MRIEKIITVAQVVIPIFVAIFLGVLAKRKRLMSQENVMGLQQFALKFGMPCVVFTSCLTADMGAESLSSMVLVLAAILTSCCLSFVLRKKRYPYHNLPMLFSAQETGMMGIPLFIILFGTQQAYRMGVLDLIQAVAAYPVIALLTTDAGENPTFSRIVRSILSSPLMIMSMLGLFLNLSGIGAWLNHIGIGGVITASTSFLSQPISALMIFSVGYNFSLAKGSRKPVLEIAGIHFCLFALFCVVIQGVFFLLPNVDSLTRWAVLLYCALPASYLSPGLGRSSLDSTVASGVCSVLTVTCLVVFCIITAAVA